MVGGADLVTKTNRNRPNADGKGTKKGQFQKNDGRQRKDEISPFVARRLILDWIGNRFGHMWLPGQLGFGQGSGESGQRMSISGKRPFRNDSVTILNEKPLSDRPGERNFDSVNRSR